MPAFLFDFITQRAFYAVSPLSSYGNPIVVIFAKHTLLF